MSLSHARHPTADPAWARWTILALVLGFLALMLILPLVAVFAGALEKGLQASLAAISDPDAISAVKLTLLVAAIAVPFNAAFGICAAWAISKHYFPGKSFLITLIDLPFSVSPVVSGLIYVLVFGAQGWFGDWLIGHGIQVIFSVPGMVIATAVVSLPFVARETTPVLRELGTAAEQAAATLGANGWQTFWRITLPAIRWGVVYGVVLTTARALGEFGAVSVVSGRIQGQTQPLPLYVQSEFENFNVTGAYTAAVVLALLALATLVVMNLLTRRTRRGTAV